MPCNAITGARYRGINVVILAMSPLAFSSGDPRWATYKQAAERGWQVRKGERGTTAYFFKRVEVRDRTTVNDEEAAKRIPLLRAFTLFHGSQIDGVPRFVPPTLEEAPWRAPEAAETIIANSGADLRIGGDRAFYSQRTDHIQMPPKSAFATAEGWCSTIMHEASHWSGGGSRLNRDLGGAFGSHCYAMEEVQRRAGAMHDLLGNRCCLRLLQRCGLYQLLARVPARGPEGDLSSRRRRATHRRLSARVPSGLCQSPRGEHRDSDRC